jgi:hypothetical protein
MQAEQVDVGTKAHLVMATFPQFETELRLSRDSEENGQEIKHTCQKYMTTRILKHNRCFIQTTVSDSILNSSLRSSVGQWYFAVNSS